MVVSIAVGSTDSCRCCLMFSRHDGLMVPINGFEFLTQPSPVLIFMIFAKKLTSFENSSAFVNIVRGNSTIPNKFFAKSSKIDFGHNKSSQEFSTIAILMTCPSRSLRWRQTLDQTVIAIIMATTNFSTTVPTINTSSYSFRTLPRYSRDDVAWPANNCFGGGNEQHFNGRLCRIFFSGKFLFVDDFSAVFHWIEKNQLY